MSIVAPESVKTALQRYGRCDSWSLRLDKLSFPDDTRGSWKKPALDLVVADFQRAASAGMNQSTMCWVEQLKSKSKDALRQLLFVNTSRLVVALGRASVLENVGLATHRASGLLRIPGSAVKGLVSTWACWEGNVGQTGTLGNRPLTAMDRTSYPHDPTGLARRIFGRDDGAEAEAGDICFLGGFPVEMDPIKLEVDILNPHPPGGNPIPSFFLTVAAGAMWRFPLLATRRAGDDYQALLDTTARWLTEALTQVGIGAKTAAGYGRFRELTPAEKGEMEAKQAAMAAKLAEEQRKREQEQKQEADKAAHEKAEAERRDKLSPEDRAYEDFKKTIGDGTAAAREILNKPESEQKLILRFFRSAEGQQILKGWKNPKGQQRIENLKKAGL
jgi:CRISPR-associated protein Cmr6